MSSKSSVEKRYFEWMYRTVCGEYNLSGPHSFRKLITYLHSVEFTFKIRGDVNRAKDGEELRYRFAYDTGCACVDSHLERPCSVLEMMIALTLRCEAMMDNPRYGDRTRQWFWRMIASLGLNGMTDSQFDENEVEQVVDRLITRKYEPNGRGGLFTVKNCESDMRRIEIWDQMCAYLNTIMR